MIFKKTFKILIISIFLLGLAGFANGEAGSLLVSNGRSQVGGDLLVLLLKIKSIELQGDIFSDKSFTNLIDFGVEIEPQPVGKDNPFSVMETE